MAKTTSSHKVTPKPAAPVHAPLATIAAGSQAFRRQTLEEWIYEALHDHDKVGSLRQLSLVHIQGASRELEVHTAEVKDRSASVLAQLFDGKARAYGQDLAGVQTFMLLAFYGESHEPTARHPFRIAGEAFRADGMSEAPDERGLAQQLMRHLEIKERISMQERASVHDAMLQTIAAVSADNRQMREDLAEAFTVVRDVLMERAINQHEFRMREIAAKDAHETKKGLLKLVPSLVNSYTGRKVFSEHATDTAMMEALAEHIDEEKLGMLDMFLPAAVAGPLKARFQEIAAQKKAEEEKTARLAAQAAVETDDPEAEVAGEIEGGAKPKELAP